MVARNRRAPQIATQRISFKPVPGGKGVKANQAWKYPGYNIVRAAGTTLNGRFYTDPKEYETDDMKATAAGLQGERPAADASGAPRRKQESNFLLTINPNQQHHGDNVPRAEKAFETALQHLHDRTILVRCLKFGPKDKYYANDRAQDVILPGVTWRANVEVGEQKLRMHAHIWVTIEHYSQIQINVPMMQREFVNGFNSAGNMQLSTLPYLDVKLLPQSDWTNVMKQYIMKGMMS